MNWFDETTLKKLETAINILKSLDNLSNYDYRYQFIGDISDMIRRLDCIKNGFAYLEDKDECK
jgi:hypothetical protein